MLRLITGCSGSGKSEYMIQKLGELLSLGTEKLLLLVPEQFTFETEKAVLERFGPSLAKSVEVSSFTRLAANLLEKHGRFSHNYADKTAKAVVMSLALDQLQETFLQYQKAVSSKGFIRACIESVEELKHNGISAEEFEKAALSARDTENRQKLLEISNIYSVYTSMLHAKFCDSLDNLQLAGELAKEKNLFVGYTVFIDEFKGFTKPEYDFLSVMLTQGKDLYLSLCLKEEKSTGLFCSVQYTKNRMLQIADRFGVKKSAPIKLDDNHRARYPELVFWEKSVLQAPDVSYPAAPLGHVKAFLAKNEYEEVDFALASICEFVQNHGYRYRDIVLMARDLTLYHDILETAFEKYHIPYFMDDSASIDHHPVSRFCMALCSVILSRYDTAELLKLLKCSLLPFTLEEISTLENYVYVWNINGEKWLKPFTANPRGFKGEWTPKDKRDLEIVNRIRDFVVEPIEKFRQCTTDVLFEKIIPDFYQLLVDLKLPEAIISSIQRYEREGEYEYSQEYRRVWEALIGILETILKSTGKIRCTHRRFFDLLELSICHTELANRPQTLDCVAVGTADRMRTNSPKLVIVLGVNEGVFPYLPKTSGLLEDKDRSFLESAGLDFQNDYQMMVMEERFIAYKALTCSTEEVLLTSRRSDLSGNSFIRSELISQIETFFGTDVIVDSDLVIPAFYCRTKETAFSRLAYSFQQDTDFTETLKDFFLADPEYHEKVKMLEAMRHKPVRMIQDTKLAEALFGTEMRLSPSRIELFYRCKFAYFCSAGLKVLPRRKAELNPLERGNVTHDLLYQLVSKEGDHLYDLSDFELKKEIQEFLHDYLEHVIGKDQQENKRFYYLFSRLNRTLFELTKRLIAEFQQSKFRPVDFELDISKTENLDPVCLTVADGSKVYVEGKIDRVDLYTENGQKYVRVVDYKSGTKKFKLNELYYGLNLQMVLYLFTIWKNGKNKYKDVLPAGVLYMPAGELAPVLDKNASPEEIQKQKLSQYKMNGFVLEDPQVISAMEQEVKGVFIPVEKNKNGEYSKRSSQMKLEELGKLEQYVDHLIREMTLHLHQGNIEDYPSYGNGDVSPCEYCDYHSVCGHREEDERNEIKNYSKDQLMKLFDGEEVSCGADMDTGAE